ncbi:MAG: transposase [Candidatus Daviesbacteria bacterium]|nr:transposase [Candidatus Daviesbacteria bacterium]
MKKRKEDYRIRWFREWVHESYSIRQLMTQSKLSKSTMNRMKKYWINQNPDSAKEGINLEEIYYIQIDGTYFHRDGCLFVVIDSMSQKIIGQRYISKENLIESSELFKELKKRGLEPTYGVLDGHQQVKKALEKVWPGIKIQRCLYHIQREGMRWLRTYPKTEAGKELRFILSRLCEIRNKEEQDKFIDSFENWQKKHLEFVKKLPNTSVAYKDLKRTVALITHAMPDMFRYLEDKNIDSTTNKLEGLFSRLKAAYRKHRGLTKQNRVQYLNWYCYFHNLKISNTF